MAVKTRMHWFRLHSEARTDAKLESLADDEFRVWFRLLCFANEQPDRGVFVGYSPRLLAVEVARGDVVLLERAITALKELRILESGEGSEIEFSHWRERQYDKESDWPENTRSRKAESRSQHGHAESRGVTRSHATYAEEDADAEGESEPERDLSSGKVGISSDDDAERANAPAAASGSPSNWTQAELRKVSKRIAGRLKLTNPDLDGLMTILAQYPCAPPYLEAEAAKCVEWYSGKRRKIDIRLYDNWLAKANQRRRQDSTPLAQSMNGHHSTETEAGTNGTTESTRRAALARETALDDERARVAAELVHDLAKLRAGG